MEANRSLTVAAPIKRYNRSRPPAEGRHSPGAIVQLANDYGSDFALLWGSRGDDCPPLSRSSPGSTFGSWERFCASGSRPACRPTAHSSSTWTASAFAVVPTEPRNCPALISWRHSRRASGPFWLNSASMPRPTDTRPRWSCSTSCPHAGSGYVITGDATFTHTEVCRAVRDRDDGYVLIVKEDQHALSADIDAGLAFAAQAATFSPAGVSRRRNRRPAHGSHERPRRGTVALSTGRWRTRRS